MNVQLIIDFRYRNKLRQSDLAEMLGLERTTVAKWETGVAMPRICTLKKLAKVMGVSVEKLVEDEE